MEFNSLKHILDRSKYDLLPTISGCLLGVLLLSALRDLFSNDQAFSTLDTLFYILCTALICGVWVARQSKKLPVHLSQLAGPSVMSSFC